jgi:hypothetical protein
MDAHQSKIHELADNQEGQEAKFQQRGYGQVLPALFQKTSGPYQCDYYVSANYESLQGSVGARRNSLSFGAASHPSRA